MRETWHGLRYRLGAPQRVTPTREMRPSRDYFYISVECRSKSAFSLGGFHILFDRQEPGDPLRSAVVVFSLVLVCGGGGNEA